LALHISRDRLSVFDQSPLSAAVVSSNGKTTKGKVQPPSITLGSGVTTLRQNAATVSAASMMYQAGSQIVNHTSNVYYHQ
jgi:hypothetical protein